MKKLRTHGAFLVRPVFEIGIFVIFGFAVCFLYCTLRTLAAVRRRFFALPKSITFAECPTA